MKWILFFAVIVFPFWGNGQIIETIAGNGTAGYTGDGGYATSATLNTPQYVTIDIAGNIYIADKSNNVIRKISPLGVINTIAGKGTAGFSGDGGAATDAQLRSPTCVVVDAANNLYIADGANYRIRKVNSYGIISTIGGNGLFGYNGDGIPATMAELTPYAIALDNFGNIFVSDVGNQRIRKINSSGIVSTIAGNGTAGYSGDGGPATIAQFHNPGYLAVSVSGDIYVPDWMNYRIRKINTAGIITTVAGTGSAGNSGDGGPASSATFTAPNAVNFDNEGNFYISDNLAYVVREVNALGIIRTVAGNGILGFSGDNGPATMAQMNRPNSVAFNAAENMYIVDAFNDRIRKVIYHPEFVKDLINFTRDLIVYPNPAQNSITITSPDKIENISIANISGQVVYQQAYNNAAKVEVRVSGFAAGVYFVKANGSSVGRFVKE